MRTAESQEGEIRTTEVLEGGLVPQAVKNFFLQFPRPPCAPPPSNLLSCIRSSPPEFLGGDFFNECSRLKEVEDEKKKRMSEAQD